MELRGLAAAQRHFIGTEPKDFAVPQPWPNLAGPLPRFSAEDLAASFLSLVGAAPPEALQQTEARGDRKELLRKG